MKKALEWAGEWRTEDPYVLTSAFWERFVKEHWERHPLVLRRPLDASLLSSGELFEAAVAICNAKRAGDRGVDLRLFMDSLLRLNEDGRLLPRQEDGDVEGYGARLARAAGEGGFGLLFNKFERSSFELWDRSRRFVHGLFSRVGFPAGRAEVLCFIGNYRATPFGLHKDSAYVFDFVVSGRKRMLVWPFEVFQEEADAILAAKGASSGDPRQLELNIGQVDYRRFLDSAIVLEGGPGDVFYWPAGYWHVAESDGGVTATVNIAITPAGSTGRVVDAAAKPWLSALPWSDGFGVGADAAGCSVDLPEPVRSALRSYQEFFGSASFERSVLVSWLGYRSRSAFRDTPPLLKVSDLVEADVVIGDSMFLILMAADPVDAEATIVASNGHVFQIPSHARILDLIKALNMGRPWRVGDLLDAFSGKSEGGRSVFVADRADVLSLLGSLLGCRAIARARGLSGPALSEARGTILRP
jgi:50S ribosomal protein L16 3-hydroxylase